MVHNSGHSLFLRTALLLLALIMLFQLCLPAAATNNTTSGTDESATASDGVSSVTLDKNGHTVNVRIQLSEQFLSANKKQTVYLFALPYGSESIDGLSPVTQFRVTDHYTYKTELTQGQLSGIYTGYQLAILKGNSYDTIGGVKFISDLTPAAPYTYAYPTVRSLKGLEVSNLSDALALNLSHAVLEADMTALLAARGGADVTDFDFNGRTCHINTAALAALDDSVRSLSGQGVRVYIRLMPGDAYDSAAGLCRLVESRADELAGLISLLAGRYTDPDAPYGFCGSLIVGRDVNLPATEPGISVTPEEYIGAYARLCRLAWAGLTSVYSHGCVYIAPSNNLSLVPDGFDTAATSIHDFLSCFNRITRDGGDYMWGVAASAYAYRREDSSIWDDALAGGASTQLISPANIHILTSLISKNYSFGGERRPVIIGSFSVSDTDSPDAQATSLAYAYYKVLENGGVDALIWGCHTEGSTVVSEDTSYSLAGHGLANTDLSGNILSRKPAWDVMAIVDTDCGGRLPAMIQGVGQGGVVDYIYNSQAVAAQTKVYITGTGAPLTTHEGLKVTGLYDFTCGERQDFELSGLGYLARPALTGYESGSALMLTPGTGVALVKYQIDRRQLSGQHKIIVSLGQCSGSGSLTLTLAQGDGRRYTAVARFERGCSEIAFDVKAFCSELDKSALTLSLSLKTDEGNGVFSVTGISKAKNTTASPVVWIIIFVTVVFVALVAILLMFTGGFHAFRRRRAASRREREGERQ